MRKLVCVLLLMLIPLGLWACRDKNEQGLENIKAKVYLLQDPAENTIIIPSLTLREDGSFQCPTLQGDGSFQFVYSALSSHIPMGSYEVKEDSLILSSDTYDGGDSKVYVFRIDGDKLIYQQALSAPLPSFASEEICDGAVFILTPLIDDTP